MAIIRDINLNACAGNDLIDRLTTLSYYITNLLRIDLYGNDLRRIRSNFLTRCCDSRHHTISHNKFSCLTASGNSTFHDRFCQSMNLDVHLDRRDTIMCTRHFKVHIAEKVFQSLNVCQQYEIIIRISCYKTTRNTRHHLLDRHTCRHQGHTGRTGGSHRSRAIGLKCLRYRADRIRELILGRQYRNQRSLRQSTMSDLSSARSTADLRLTYRIRREIVMMHISFTCYILIQTVHSLYFRQRRQCTYIADLRLSASEHGRTMHSWNYVNFRCKRPDLIQCTAIRTLVILQDHLTHCLLLILIYCLTQHCKIRFVLCKRLFQLGRNISDILLTHLLLVCKDRCLHLLRCYDLLHILKHLLRNRTTLISMLRLPYFCNNLINKLDKCLVHLMSLIDRL